LFCDKYLFIGYNRKMTITREVDQTDTQKGVDRKEPQIVVPALAAIDHLELEARESVVALIAGSFYNQSLFFSSDQKCAMAQSWY